MILNQRCLDLRVLPSARLRKLALKLLKLAGDVAVEKRVEKPKKELPKKLKGKEDKYPLYLHICRHI